MASKKEETLTEFDEVQVKAFTSWINSYLAKRGMKVVDLKADLADGVKLINFLEIATGKSVGKYYDKPKMDLHKIQNFHVALNFIKSLGIRLHGIAAEDLHNGNIKLILGLLYSLFKSNIGSFSHTGDDSNEQLLKWAQSKIGHYKGISLDSIRSGFSDGLAFCALLHAYNPELINYDGLDPTAVEANLKQAFELAEKHLNIPRLVEPSDLIAGRPDERSLVLYVSLLFHAFKSKEEDEMLRQEKEQEARVESDMQHTLEAEAAELEALIQRNKQLAAAKAELEERLSAGAQRVDAVGDQSAALSRDLEQLKVGIAKVESLLATLEAEAVDVAATAAAASEVGGPAAELGRKLADESQVARQRAEQAERQRAEHAALSARSTAQSHARKALALLGLHLDEHLEDLYKWRELHNEADEVDPANRADIKAKALLTAGGGAAAAPAAVVATTAPFAEAVEVLNGKLEAENRTMSRLLKKRDAAERPSEPVDYAGTLAKKGQRRANWKPRHVVLRGNRLLYYKTDGPAAVAKGTLLLDAAGADVVMVNDEAERPYVLKVVTPDRTLVLQAQSEAERAAWVGMLRARLAFIKYKKMADDDAVATDPRLLELFAAVFTETATTGDAAAAAAGGSPTALHLDDKPVSTATLTAVFTLLPAGWVSRLRVVSLCNASLADHHVEQLCSESVLPKLAELAVLRLARNKLTNAAAIALAKGLPRHALVELNLHDNQIDDAGIMALAEYIGQHPPRGVLDLSKNSMGDKGVRALCEALCKPDHQPLQRLVLSNNALTSASAAELAKVLRLAGSSLAALLLRGNKLGDDAVAALAEALAANGVLKELDLSDNEFGNAGVAALCKLLETNSALSTIVLNGTRLKGGVAIGELLRNDAFYFPSLSFARSGTELK